MNNCQFLVSIGLYQISSPFYMLVQVITIIPVENVHKNVNIILSDT